MEFFWKRVAKMNRKAGKIYLVAMISIITAVLIAVSASFSEPMEEWSREDVPAAEPFTGIGQEEPAAVMVKSPAVKKTVSLLHNGGDMEFELNGDDSEEIAEVELMMPFDSAGEAAAEYAAAGEVRGLSDNVPVYLQLQYLPDGDAYIYSHEKKVNGLALGYYLPQQEISGVSLALCHMYNMKKSGLSLSLLDMCADSNGVTFFLVGGSVVNRGVSMGLWNMTENNKGMQLGLFNREEEDLLLDYDLKPQERDDSFGVQAGLVNYSDTRGIQFGLWNVNPNSWIKYFPVFNICL